MEAHYLRRLKTVARGAEIFAEAERARLEVASTRRRAQALTEVNHALRQESRHWQSAALRDSLTQLLNRRGLEEHARALIHRPIPLAVLVIDADHFKGVNDQHGHAIGDAVLRHLAELFTSHGRVSDIVARTGGEEFVLLLADIDAEATEAACERLRQQVERHAWALLVPGLAVTVSIGAAVRRGPIDLDSLLREADAALYRAKAAGRNRVRMAPRR